MSLATNILNLAIAAATEIKATNGRAGDLTALSTSTKTNLVAAINELNAAVADASGIDDNTTGTATSWSSSKTAQQITEASTAVKNELLGGAGGAYDTLGELQTLLTTNGDAIAALTAGLGNRLRIDAAQSLSGAQQAQGRANLDVYGTAQIGDPDTDFVAAFNAALA